MGHWRETVAKVLNLTAKLPDAATPAIAERTRPQYLNLILVRGGDSIIYMIDLVDSVWICIRIPDPVKKLPRIVSVLAAALELDIQVITDDWVVRW